MEGSSGGSGVLLRSLRACNAIPPDAGDKDALLACALRSRLAAPVIAPRRSASVSIAFQAFFQRVLRVWLALLCLAFVHFFSRTERFAMMVERLSGTTPKAYTAPMAPIAVAAVESRLVVDPANPSPTLARAASVADHSAAADTPLATKVSGVSSSSSPPATTTARAATARDTSFPSLRELVASRVDPVTNIILLTSVTGTRAPLFIWSARNR